MRGKFDSWLADTAARQHGLVALWQVVEHGWSARHVEVRAGTSLHRVHRGVYAVGHPSLTPDGRWMAAALVGGRGCAVSHVSAAVLQRMLETAGATIHVTVPGSGGRIRRDGLVLHRSRSIERMVVRGIPVTTPARTLVDLAATAPQRTVDAAVRGAERQRIFDLDAVKAAARGRKGAAKLKVAIAQWDGTPTKSELEIAFLALCARHGIVRPMTNVSLLGYTLDFVWPDHRVVVETDGMAWHGTVADAIADRERDAALTRAGYRPQRFTWGQITRREQQRDTAATLAALGLAYDAPLTISTRSPSGSRR